jgi:pterin-4a-carbinolamine dehydratase
MSTKSHQWREKASPARLERRFEFDDYQGTREFLERAAELSEHTRVYPDVSFGRTYVNMTVYMDQEGADHEPRVFARMLDESTAPALA